eukprot:TRINITY_DN1500_c0_g1_i1.p1 TRINITY_DN1500_c0_g1~~TRINITY_DN1500_c0_g1_i1.p1  ORF type:complete len:707 (+),score=228.57 TRINITY_DN1500_c0_g1_i1:347-2467(+)
MENLQTQNTATSQVTTSNVANPLGPPNFKSLGREVRDLLSNQPIPSKKNSSLIYNDIVKHPLDMITMEEIKTSASITRKHFGKLSKTLRFWRVDLKEPPKSMVFDFETGKIDTFTRESLVVLVEPQKDKVYEVVVNLFPRGEESIISCTHIENVQVGFLSDEYEMCEIVVKQDPRVRDSLKRRGITDLNSVMVDAWTSFFSGPEVRLCNPLLFVRATDSANGYDRPIDGLDIYIDMNKMEVTSVKDLFIVPVPQHDPIAQWQMIKNVRPDLKPYQVLQPEGPSFVVTEGQQVYWQNWHFKIGFTQWEGLVLHRVEYDDAETGKRRSVMYRASFAEMVVPYGDPRPPNCRKNAFDAGEDGFGRNCHSLELGCDCLGAIHYFDAHLVDSKGIPYKIKNAVCLHEEDYGILWKHKDWRTGIQEVRRSRRLVVSFFTTIANYDYGFYWYFHLDGSIKCEAKLTGILSTSALGHGEKPGGYGTMVAPNLYAPIHQHFFIVRLDMQVDGVKNAIQEINVKIPEENEPNPHKSAFYATETTLKTEHEAARVINANTSRLWKIVNINTKNRNGDVCGWKLVPSNNAPAYALEGSKIIQRAGFIKKSIWVTPYHPEEKYPAGNYVYQKEIEDGLTHWTKANRNVYDTDIVVWYSFGITHVVRAEDWPVMPVEYAGFDLKPDNFFGYSPAMDVPPAPSKANKKDCCSVDVTVRAKL